MAPLCEWPGAPEAGVDFLTATFKAKPLKHWMEWLATLDICYGPVNTLPEAIADPNLLARGMVVTDDQGRKHFAPVVRFKDEPSTPLYREPLLGEHTDEVLGRLIKGSRCARDDSILIGASESIPTKLSSRAQRDFLAAVSSSKSAQVALIVSTSASFLDRRQALISFSRAIASMICSCDST